MDRPRNNRNFVSEFNTITGEPTKAQSPVFDRKQPRDTVGSKSQMDYLSPTNADKLKASLRSMQRPQQLGVWDALALADAEKFREEQAQEAVLKRKRQGELREYYLRQQIEREA